MTPRITKLRQASQTAQPRISIERALLETEFYQANHGKYSTPALRALTFKHLCRNKAIYIGAEELIVGERGPAPKAVPTFPELTCHSERDLHTFNARTMTRYAVSEATRGEREIPPPNQSFLSSPTPDTPHCSSHLASLPGPLQDDCFMASGNRVVLRRAHPALHQWFAFLLTRKIPGKYSLDFFFFCSDLPLPLPPSFWHASKTWH